MQNGNQLNSGNLKKKSTFETEWFDRNLNVYYFSLKDQDSSGDESIKNDLKILNLTYRKESGMYRN